MASCDMHLGVPPSVTSVTQTPVTHTHLGVPPLVSQSSQKERMMVSMAISYTAKKISAMMNPVRKQMATGSTGLVGSLGWGRVWDYRKISMILNLGQEADGYWQYMTGGRQYGVMDGARAGASERSQ